jgi:hypothetical protein
MPNSRKSKSVKVLSSLGVGRVAVEPFSFVAQAVPSNKAIQTNTIFQKVLFIENIF